MNIWSKYHQSFLSVSLAALLCFTFLISSADIKASNKLSSKKTVENSVVQKTLSIKREKNQKTSNQKMKKIRKLNLNAWEVSYNWNGTSEMEKKNGMLVIKNTKFNHACYTQTVSVKPHTNYRIRALVRVDSYKQGKQNPGGVTVGYGDPSKYACLENDFITSNKWKKSEAWFCSGKNKKVTLYVANGGFAAITKGTAYIKDIILEELDTNNKWNVLALIYKNIKTPTYQDSFSDTDVKELKTILEKVPDSFKRLSNKRMLINTMDIKVIDKPVKTISDSESAYAGTLTYGRGNDINFDQYLKGKDYNQIIIYAPTWKLVLQNDKKEQWGGLGGTYYRYKGRNIYTCIINIGPNVAGIPSVDIYGENYDSRICFIVHEMLHCVETNSRLRGYSDFTALHDGKDHGYVDSREVEWMDYYSDLMKDTIKSGAKGFHKTSFYVPHKPK